jgi:hypothetical protein
VSIATDQTIFNIYDASEYLRSRGAKSATPWWVRSLIVANRIPSQKVGRAFVVTRADLDAFVTNNAKRKRP